MDLTHKDENTESTEERTIMMDSIKALHTGEVRNEADTKAFPAVKNRILGTVSLRRTR